MYRKKAFFRAFESFEAEREKVRGGGGLVQRVRAKKRK